MLTEVLASPAVWIFAIGTTFTAGGVVFMATETTKKVNKLEKDKMDREDCDCIRGDLKDGMKELRGDVKEISAILHEVVGELKNLNGRK